MEGKSHSSKSYRISRQLPRMQEDLLTCSKDFASSFQQRIAIRASTTLPSDDGTTTIPSVGVVGAGLAGLRCAEILITKGVRVTVLEARDRIGGRIHQRQLNGHTVDMGPNWVHGTEDNPIVKIAKEANSRLCLIDDTTRVYSPQGLPWSDEKATAGFERVWNMLLDAFKYSNESCPSITSGASLKDFFKAKLAEQSLDPESQDQILLLAEMWGAFIGDSWDRQSLKWFWLEECLDGENLFVAESHKSILRHVAENALLHADVHLSTSVGSIESKGNKGENPKVLVRTNKCNFEFDEIVVTVPLGCLKRDTIKFKPPVLPEISRAISHASYSRLEKVYISFPVAFWDLPTPTSKVTRAKSLIESSMCPSFVHYLHPQYVPEEQKSWTLELVALSSPDLFGDQAQASLLFYTYGPCATHVASLIDRLSPTSSEYFQVINNFFCPYYSLLPNYIAGHPDCTPIAVLATNWQNDDLAGNGSYMNFQIRNEANEPIEEAMLDEDIRAMRKGMPERGIWFAGEHTAPFVAVATTTGAYWSGESVGIRILGAYGLLPESSTAGPSGVIESA